MGLSLALELTRRGARVVLLESGQALGQASSAAAGMLAAHDPANPPQLTSLAELSLSLYPAFLDHIANLSDVRVPFQTDLTLQGSDHASADSLSPSDVNLFLPSHNLSDLHFTLLDEHSVDPRQLASALLAAAKNTGIRLLAGTPLLKVDSSGPDLTVITTGGGHIHPSHFVDCTGAWAVTCPGSVFPRKGQMLSVALPPGSPLSLVVRTEHLYIVPRSTGPHAGQAVIGATVEDAGFDQTVHPEDIARLRGGAIDLLPSLAGAPVIDQWAGIRPATGDQLPLLGASPSSPAHLFATGHFRNGILLAPATAHVISQLILGEQPPLDLSPFAPGRFRADPTS